MNSKQPHNIPFSIAISDDLSKWYHTKSKEERRTVLNQVRSFLQQLKLTEKDSNPDLVRLKKELETIKRDVERHDRAVQELQTKRYAIQSRVEQLQVVEEEKKRKESARNSEKAILDYWKNKVVSGVWTLDHVRDVASGYAQPKLITAFEEQHKKRFGRNPKLDARQVCEQLMEVF